MSGQPVITLLTDFGARDHYAASMKAVIASRSSARVIDITHEVAPQDVAGASYQLACCRGYFPAGSVHVVVVDPGVGSDRRAVAVAAGGYRYIAPDNGVLDMALSGAEVVEAFEVREERFFLQPVSATFHGRDVFAPVAAAVFEGCPLSELGPPAGELVHLDLPHCRLEGGVAEGSVIHVDRFGNVVTSVAEGLVGGREVARVEIGGFGVPFARTYADVAEGHVLAYWGSGGFLEIAVRGGSAADVLSAGVGRPVLVRLSA